MTLSEILAAASTLAALVLAVLYLTERGRVAYWRGRYYHDTGSAEGAIQELEAMLRAHDIDLDAPMSREVNARYLAEIAKTTPPQMSAPSGDP